MQNKINESEKRAVLQYLLKTELLTSPTEIALAAGFSFERTEEILRWLINESLVTTGKLCHGFAISDNGTYEHHAGDGFKATPYARSVMKLEARSRR